MTATDPALLHRDPQYTYPVLVKGEGIYLYDEASNRYIDGTAGAGNVTLGHGRHAIVEAMADQGRELTYCFSTFFTNPPALEYARRLAELAPGDLNHAYFVSGGSEGVETAIKLARLYHVQRRTGAKVPDYWSLARLSRCYLGGLGRYRDAGAAGTL